MPMNQGSGHCGATLFILLLLSAIGFFPATVAANDSPPNTPQSAIPFEPWADPCGYPLPVPAEYADEINRLIEATAFLVPVNQIEQRQDDPNFWRLKNTGPFVNYPLTNTPMCPGAPFLGEERLATQGRTGFLVAPDIIVTASHSNPYKNQLFNPADFVVVFGMNNGKYGGQSCKMPDTQYIPATNVFKSRAIEPLIIDTLLSDPETGADYAAFYLQNKTNRKYVRLRRNGLPENYDLLAVASNPGALREKLQTNVHFVDIYDIFCEYCPSLPSLNFDGIYSLKGTSGAPVYNLNRKYAEIGIANDVGSCVDSWPEGQCQKVVDKCVNSSKKGFMNLGQVKVLADHLPTPELRVSPLKDVTYILDKSSPPPAPTVYEITASPNAIGDTLALASVSQPLPDEPQLLMVPNGIISLSPGQKKLLVATPSIPADIKCGTYDRYVRVLDGTHGFTDIVRHRFEIGLTEFLIKPPPDEKFQFITLPSNPTSITYKISNPRPTPVTVEISTDAPWIRINGVQYLILIEIPGLAKDIDVNITLDATAANLPKQEYSAKLIFKNFSECELSPTVYIQNITLEKGKITYTGKIFDSLIHPTNIDNSNVFKINTPNNICINDVQVDLETLHINEAGLNLGVPLSDWMPYVNFSLERTRGILDPIKVLLWNNQSLPINWNIPTYTLENDYPITDLLINRYGNSPPNGNSLTPFLGSNDDGHWQLRIADSRPADQPDQQLINWKLTLTGYPRIGQTCAGKQPK